MNKDSISSNEFYKLIVEHGEAVAKNTADKAVKQIKEYMDCRDSCSNQANDIYTWMGFQRIFNRDIPVTFLFFSFLAIISFFLSVYNLII